MDATGSLAIPEPLSVLKPPTAALRATRALVLGICLVLALWLVLVVNAHPRVHTIRVHVTPAAVYIEGQCFEHDGSLLCRSPIA